MYLTLTERSLPKTLNLLAVLLLMLLVGRVGWACQDPPAQTGGSPLDGRRFLKLREDISQIDKQINDLFVSMPIRFPEEQKKHTAKIEELKQAQVTLRKELDQAAIESFSADPEGNVLAGNHIGQLMIASLEGRAIDRPFDPQRAQELVQLLLDKGVNQPRLYFFGYLASFAQEKFDMAEEFLSQYEQAAKSKETGIREGLQKIRENWDREAEFRTAEAQRDDLPRVRLTTDAGVIEVELFEDQMPNTVANFVSLVDQGFYDGSTFFQVIPGQIARTGCPEQNGKGNPGYFISPELPSARRNFFAGTLGMYQDSNGRIGSQFFVTYSPAPTLEANYTSFGRIISGMEVVYRFKMAELNPDRPMTTDIFSKIVKAEVIRKRDHDYKPQKVPTQLDLGPLTGTDPLSSEIPKTDSQETDSRKSTNSGVKDVAPPPVKDQR
jgi:cyclophilin family peptidyl-prolyl cis-trans isomerase